MLSNMLRCYRGSSGNHGSSTMNTDHSQSPEFADDSPAPSSSDVAPSDPDPSCPPDPLTVEVLAQLEQPPQQKTWIQTLALLAFSLIMFSGMGLLSYSLPDLTLLVGVLFFHEMGHYLGM